MPDSAGVPRGDRADTLTLPFNDAPRSSALFAEQRRGDRRRHRRAGRRQHGLRAARAGVPRSHASSSASQHGALSIFDEVMTGCRVARGGAQERYGITPDMTCLGKIVGGGMPLAAYGGRAEIMKDIAPLGPVYQAGTLSGNPVAVSAGLATLERLDPRALRKARGHRRVAREGLTRAIANGEWPRACSAWARCSRCSSRGGRCGRGPMPPRATPRNSPRGTRD